MNNIINQDVVIIGGGASGLLSAIKIKDKNKRLRVSVIESNERVGKKLLITGNGKCNISNTDINSGNYTTQNIDFLDSILSKANSKSVVKCFEDIGVFCRSDKQGRIYPYSERASSVLDALRLEISRLNIHVYCKTLVLDIKKLGSGFFIKTSKFEIKTNSLIIACGGKASPKTGSDGNLFPILKKLGLKIIKPFPALVPIKVKESNFISSLQGLRVKACIKILMGSNIIDWRKGEIQFRRDSLSGICIFDLSKYVSEFFSAETTNKSAEKTLKLFIDFFPDTTNEQLFSFLKNRKDLYSFAEFDEIFSSVINKKLATTIIKCCKVKPTEKTINISDSTLIKIVDVFKKLILTPVGTLSFDDAQVSAGGLDCSEFDPDTMMSNKIKNLYAVGEVLDITGDCGGYNLNFAWVSALICANSFKL